MLHTFGTFLADTTDHHQTRFDNWFGIFEPQSVMTGQKPEMLL